MKTSLFFFILALIGASCTTAIINSPAKVVGVMQSKKNPDSCTYLVTYQAKRSHRIKEAWISGNCNEYIVNDTLIHHVNSEIEVVRHFKEDRE